MFSTITNYGIDVIPNNEDLKDKKLDGIILKDNLDNENILVVVGYAYQDNGEINHDVKIIGKISWDTIPKYDVDLIKNTVKFLKEEAIKIFYSISDLSELDYPKIRMDDVLAQRIMMLFEK